MRRVWDFPTRVFHWALVSCFTLAWLSDESEFLIFHVLFGYMIAGLILFRLAWGFVGGYYSRFAQFWFSWSEVRVFIAELISFNPKRYMGHNPAGSWAIFIMLGLLLLILFSGLLVWGGQEQHGPMAGLIKAGDGEAMEEVHEFLANLMLLAILVHIGGLAVTGMI